VVEVIERAFTRHADGEGYLAGMRMAVPGVGELYGVKVPVLRKMADVVIRAYKNDGEATRAIALDSWGRGSREHQLLALFILAKIKLEPAERWELGVIFLPDVDNWESCDQLCAALFGEALAKDPGYMDVIEGWVEDENLWVRRAALVAPVYLRRAKYPEQVSRELNRRTLALCRSLLDDGEKYIRKAVDWSIRQAIRRNYDLGSEWMLAQAAAKNSRIGRATLKLAAKKLTETDRKVFLARLVG
jgi:3-methyladenine DNA glycosylase AlkD